MLTTDGYFQRRSKSLSALGAAVMTDISMGQRSRSGRGVFADTGDQLLNFSFKYGDPVAIPRPYDSGGMGWAIARDLVSVGHVQDQRLRFRGYGVGYRPEKNCTWVADPRLNFVSSFSVGSTRLIQLPSQNFLRGHLESQVMWASRCSF